MVIRDQETHRKQHKKKVKQTCNCKAPQHVVNDVVVLFLPLYYDQTSSIFHASVTWYISCCHSADLNNMVLNEMYPEWGVIDGKYYAWPLYTGQLESVDETINFIHNFIDGMIRTPLINKIPSKMDNLKKLTTVLLCNELLPDDGYNGFHSMEGKCDNTILLCCRGFVKTCNCSQDLGEKNKRSFKKREDLSPKNSLFLCTWPYPHKPADQDQLFPILNKMKNVMAPKDLVLQESTCENCIKNMSFEHQSCFYQQITLLSNDV